MLARDPVVMEALAELVQSSRVVAPENASAALGALGLLMRFALWEDRTTHLTFPPFPLYRCQHFARRAVAAWQQNSVWLRAVAVSKPCLLEGPLGDLVQEPQALPLEAKQGFLWYEIQKETSAHCHQALDVACDRDDVLAGLEVLIQGSQADQLPLPGSGAEQPQACDGFQRLVEVTFVSEKAVGDGVRREWLNLVAEKLCDPTRGLVTLDGEGSICLCTGGWHHRDQERILQETEILGRITALALRHRECVPCARLSLPLVRWGLQGGECELDDLRVIDPELYGNKFEYLQSRQYLTEGLTLQDLGLYFVDGSPDRDGGEVELVKGGSEVPVTEATLARYIDLCGKARLKGDGTRLAAFRRGWSRELSPAVCKVLKECFDPRECQILISGAEDIDVAEMRRWTEYETARHGIHEDDEDALWFWENMESFSSVDKASCLF